MGEQLEGKGRRHRRSQVCAVVWTHVHEPQAHGQGAPARAVGPEPGCAVGGRSATADAERDPLGYNAFSGMSWVSFADCAHAMMTMLNLDDDTWVHEVPIVQN